MRKTRIGLMRTVLLALLGAGCEGPTGPTGPGGPTGPEGPTGPASGASATDPAKITASIYCGGLVEGSVYFSYDVVQFANGNVFASASIKGSASEATGVTFYSPSQVGWTTAAVLVTFDVYTPADAGWWKLSLDRTSLVITIEYNDLGMPTPKRTWTMTPDKCVVNSY